MAINRDRVYNQTCRLPHGIHVMSNFFITSDLKVFELITKIRVSNNTLRFINYTPENTCSNMPCCRRVFKPILCFTISSECLL